MSRGFPTALFAIILNSVDEQIKMLNVAPQIVPKLQVLLSDGNTNPDDILDLIRLDSAMAARGDQDEQYRLL